MKKQLYLNFSYSKWIWLFGGVMIIVNLTLTAFQSADNIQPLIEIINILNIIALGYTMSSMQSIHARIRENDSHQFLYALPVRKSEILRADCIYHIIMLLFTVAVFSSYVTIGHKYHLYYGLLMLVGASLFMMSLYNIMFSQTWIQNVYIKTFIYFIPLGIIFMFHVMPLNNTFIYDLDLGAAWEFYLFRIPFIVLVAGALVYAVSYYFAKKKIIKSDII